MLLLEGVKKSYVEPDGRLLPIIDIDRWSLEKGQQTALVGRSGCGKTTLLHMIAGISRADAGRIVLDGLDVAKLSEAQRDLMRADKIGYVFQTFNLLPGFSALENVLLGMTFARRRKDSKRAWRLLERVGLGHRMSHRPGALSVGEQQRVAVARALANQPTLMLADEPTANVDQVNQQNIIDLICDTCREEKVSLILVTHAAEVASQFERVERLEEINQAGKRTVADEPSSQVK